MNRILVGLDASPRTEDLLESAVDLARRIGAKLILFRAVGLPHEIPIEAYTLSPAALGELLEREAKQYLDKVSAAVSPGLVLETVVGVGTPWQAICAAADHHQADLIIIGSHGYSGLDKLIGTTAGKVVNHAKQSVLVVRGRPSFEPHA